MVGCLSNQNINFWLLIEHAILARFHLLQARCSQPMGPGPGQRGMTKSLVFSRFRRPSLPSTTSSRAAHFAFLDSVPAQVPYTIFDDIELRVSAGGGGMMPSSNTIDFVRRCSRIICLNFPASNTIADGALDPVPTSRTRQPHDGDRWRAPSAHSATGPCACSLLNVAAIWTQRIEEEQESGRRSAIRV